MKTIMLGDDQLEVERLSKIRITDLIGDALNEWERSTQLRSR
jgi:hypothetical protein